MSEIKLIIHNGNAREQKLSMSVKNEDDLLTLFNQFSKIKRIDGLINVIDRFQDYFRMNFYESLLCDQFSINIMQFICYIVPIIFLCNFHSSFRHIFSEYVIDNQFIYSITKFVDI